MPRTLPSLSSAHVNERKAWPPETYAYTISLANLPSPILASLSPRAGLRKAFPSLISPPPPPLSHLVILSTYLLRPPFNTYLHSSVILLFPHPQSPQFISPHLHVSPLISTHLTSHPVISPQIYSSSLTSTHIPSHPLISSPPLISPHIRSSLLSSTHLLSHPLISPPIY